MIITARRMNPNGYSTNQYLVFDANADPANDPQLEVKPGDEMLKFVLENDVLVAKEYVRDYTNTGWIQRNDWDYIKNKPEEYPPERHDFYGSKHFGRRPLPEDEHTMENNVHQAIAAISLAFAF